MNPSQPAVAPALNVLVVDDHELVRLGVRQLLAGRGPVREAADIGGALACLAEFPCELLLLDLALGDDFGLTALPRLRAACPGAKIIVLSSLPEDVYAERSLKAGADGFVSKSELSATLLGAIDTVLSGRVHVSPSIRETLLRRVTAGPKARPELSPREIEVLRLVAAGNTTREIAETLNRSVKTIESHKQALKAKLGAETPVQLLRQAVHWFGDLR